MKIFAYSAVFTLRTRFFVVFLLTTAACAFAYGFALFVFAWLLGVELQLGTAWVLGMGICLIRARWGRAADALDYALRVRL